MTKQVDMSVVGAAGPSIIGQESNYNSSCFMIVSHIAGYKNMDYGSHASTVGMIKKQG